MERENGNYHTNNDNLTRNLEKCTLIGNIPQIEILVQVSVISFLWEETGWGIYASKTAYRIMRC